MMKHKSSGPKYDRIFSRISSGKSFSDLGLQVITDGSEHTSSLLQNENNDKHFLLQSENNFTSFLLQHESNADAICNWSYRGSKILKQK